MPDDIFPAASLARAYKILDPPEENVYVVGMAILHHVLPVLGVLADSVIRYHDIHILSTAVKVDILSVNHVAVAGMVNEVIVGGVVSNTHIFSK